MSFDLYFDERRPPPNGIIQLYDDGVILTPFTEAVEGDLRERRAMWATERTRPSLLQRLRGQGSRLVLQATVDRLHDAPIYVVGFKGGLEEAEAVARLYAENRSIARPECRGDEITSFVIWLPEETRTQRFMKKLGL